MERKAYVFTETFGEYDSSSKSIHAVLIGPDKIDLQNMRREYCEYIEQYGADLKEKRKGLTPKEKRKLKWEPKKFHDWVAEAKGMEKLEFEEIEW